jgi:hypothetical protein
MTDKPSNEELVALDLAAILAHSERSHEEWLPVQPKGDETGAELVAGYAVLPHVQSFADKVRVATGVKSIGTYPGHSPSIDRALDLFVPVSSRTLGDAICAFALGRREQFGVRYVIYRQHIWHRLDRRWVLMEDRGDLTQNHFDHVHVSFETTAAEVPDPPKPEPKPEPRLEELTMFVFDAPLERGGGVWQSDGVLRKPVRTGDTWPAVEAAGAKHIGVAPIGLFDDLIDIERELARLRETGGVPVGVDISSLADLVAAQIGDRLAQIVADVIHERLAS